MKFLLVDDSTTMRNIQRKILSGLGHNDIAEAADGGLALAAFNSERPDVVFVDWNMPNMDGLTLVKKIREVDKNVLLMMAIARCPKAEKYRLAREALNQVGLEGKESRMAGELSGGEKGRVAVARAIVNHPPILLADEPTGNLDQATSTQVLDLLRSLHEERQTVVMVTHDKHAASYADHVFHILDGRIANGQGTDSEAS